MSLKLFIQAKEIVTHLLENNEYSLGWLRNFCYQTYNFADKSDSAMIDELVKLLPYEGGTLYAGFNFLSEDSYNEFMKEHMHGTKFSSDTASKWHADIKDVDKQATGNTSDWYGSHKQEKMYVDKDFMVGHAGIILQMHINADKAIDTSQDKSLNTKGIIVIPAGQYECKVVKKHIPFIQSINKDNFKSEFLSINSIDGEVFDNKKFQHIMFHYKDFDNEMSSHLMKLILPTLDNIKWSVDVDMHWNSSSKHPFGSSKSKYPIINVDWDLPEEFLYYHEFLSDNDADEMDSKIISVLKTIDRDFNEKTSDIDWVDNKFELNINNGLKAALTDDKYSNVVHFQKHVRRKIGLAYNVLNSYEETKRINAIKDPEEKRQAIRDIGKRIADALNQIK